MNYEASRFLYMKTYQIYKNYVESFITMGKEIDNNYRWKIFKRIRRIAQ
jgi:hypothetical protein